jgi:hypothetical protein
MPFILFVPLPIQGAFQLVNKRKADAESPCESPSICNLTISKEMVGVEGWSVLASVAFEFLLYCSNI